MRAAEKQGLRRAEGALLAAPGVKSGGSSFIRESSADEILFCQGKVRNGSDGGERPIAAIGYGSDLEWLY
jgi:hypothetical protein